jgi:hypothetical protein
LSPEPELLDLADMPLQQLSAMVTLLIQVQASARAIPIRHRHKARVLRLRSLELVWSGERRLAARANGRDRINL